MGTKETLFRLQLKHCGRLPSAPACATRFKINMNFCNTCCCRPGLTKINIIHELVHGSQKDCGAFFTFTDAFVRMVVSMKRALEIMMRYTDSCFSSTHDAANADANAI